MKAPPKLLAALASSFAFFSCASTADIARATATAEGVDPAHPFPESAFVESFGLSIHYRHWVPDRNWISAGDQSGGEAGQGPRGTILLLHGFGSSTFSFRFLVPRLLAAGWEVAAADIPPFGYSDKSDAIANPGIDQGGLLWAVPDALGWKGNVVLLGHSMGGFYATAMAERDPPRVRAMILLAGAVPTDGKNGGGPPFFASLFAGILESHLHSWSGVKSDLRSFAGGDVPDEMVDGYAAPFQLPGGVKALLAWSDWRARQNPLHPSVISNPTLLVWGEKDSVVPLERGKKLAIAIANSCLVVLPGLGHLAHELQSEEVNAVLIDFLSKLEVLQ